MISKLLIKVFGFILMVIGLSYIIVYINLLSFGYTVREYFSYILTRYECWFFIIGLVIEIIVIFRKGKNNGKHI